MALTPFISSALPVAAGGALGAVLRHAVGQAFASGPDKGAAALPVATLCVNVVGSLLMGMLAAWLARNSGGNAGWRLFLGVGVLGGFTTFSAFSLEVVVLMERGAWLLAAIYAGMSVALSVGALWLGLLLARNLT